MFKKLEFRDFEGDLFHNNNLSFKVYNYTFISSIQGQRQCLSNRLFAFIFKALKK